MKKSKIIIPLAIAFLVLTGCNNNSKLEKKEVNVEPKSELKTIENNNKEKKDISENVNQNENSKLLLGKWQSDDDKTNFLIFEKNHRKEIAAGMNDWQDEEFTLSDHCLNESDINSNNPREKDSYISCKDSDLCWYILSITSEKLTLQYMGRGNTLMYSRMKE